MRIFRKILKLCLPILLLTGFINNAFADKLGEIRERGSLRMAGIVNEDPYFRKDPRSGEWRGFAVEMARDIAKTIGVKLEVVESSWGNSILDVQSGKVDLALALTALPKRAMSIHFTSPTYYNSFVIISPKSNLKGKSWSELNNSQYTFAVDLGSAQDNITKQYLPKANVLRFKSRDEAIVAVAAGKADALVNSVLNGMVMTKKNKKLGNVYVPKPIMSSPSVIGLNYNTDAKWKTFVSAWADFNRRVGNNQTWIINGLAPFGIGLDDLPEGFDVGG
jgi:polar amino acid transport system substrate-binding protein